MNNEEKLKKYNEDSLKLIELIGKDNVITVTHCITRLRFVLKDSKNLPIKEIEKIDSVQGTFSAGGQFQVIIGTDVPKFYNIMLQNNQFKAASKAEVKDVVQQRGNWFQRAIGWFSSIFVPVIPIIVVGGLILAFRNLLETNWAGDGTSAVATSDFLKGLNNFLWVIGNAIFVFLPVYLIWAIFDRAKLPGTIGICIGIIIVSPTAVNLYDIYGAIGSYYFPYTLTYTNAEGAQVTFSQGTHSYADIQGAMSAFGITMPDESTLTSSAEKEAAINAAIVQYETLQGITTPATAYYIDTINEAVLAKNAYWAGWTSAWMWAIQYNAQVLPAILIGLFAVWLYKFVDRHTWSAIGYVWPPFAVIIGTSVVAFGVLGPIGAYLQYYIGLGFYYGFTNEVAKWFVGPLFGLLYAPMVVTGLHYAMNPVMLQLSSQWVEVGGVMTQVNANYMFPILAVSNMAQGAAVFAVVWMARKDRKFKEMGVSAGVTCWLGVTEPAMYGSNVKYMFPFVASCLATFVSSFLIIGLDITGVGIGMGGILAPLSTNINGTYGIHAYWIFTLIMVFTVILAFVLTMVLSKMTKFTDRFATSNWTEYLADLNLIANKATAASAAVGLSATGSTSSSKSSTPKSVATVIPSTNGTKPSVKPFVGNTIKISQLTKEQKLVISEMIKAKKATLTEEQKTLVRATLIEKAKGLSAADKAKLKAFLKTRLQALDEDTKIKLREVLDERKKAAVAKKVAAKKPVTKKPTAVKKPTKKK